MYALFLTINKFVLSDWEIDCKWIAMKTARALNCVYWGIYVYTIL